MKRKLITVESIIKGCQQAEEHIMWSNCLKCPWRDKCEEQELNDPKTTA